MKSKNIIYSRKRAGNSNTLNMYTMVSVSLCWPKVVPVSALSAFSLGLHLVTMLVTCGANDMEVLYVTPRILVSCVCVE